MVCSYALLRLGDNASHIAEDGGAITDASSSHPWWKPSRIWWGGYWNYAPKRMAFLKWAALTYLGLKRAVLTHDVVQTTDTLEDDQPAVQGICWGQPWMNKACFI